jgi:hypothetical protein
LTARLPIKRMIVLDLLVHVAYAFEDLMSGSGRG